MLAVWKVDLENVTETHLERIKIEENETAENVRYDLVTNLPGKGNFVISVSTDREEVCVWNAAK